jgi:tRNA pseudouridine13 synthase
MLTTSSIYESDEVREAREQIKDDGVTEQLVDLLPKELRYEKHVAKSLVRNPRDYKTAFLRIPPRIQTLFVHAYQSYLFNLLLSKRFEEGIPLLEPQIGDFLIRLDQSHTGRDDWLYASERKIPELSPLVETGTYAVAGTIPGYASKLPNTRQTEQLRRLLSSEGVQLSDFKNNENQHLDSPGGLHLLSNLLSEITSECDEGDVIISFKLRKGCYATVVLREIMKNDPINRA